MRTVLHFPLLAASVLCLTSSDICRGQERERGSREARLVLPIGHSGGVTSVAFSPDGKRVFTGGRDGTARLWDVQTGKELLAFHGHTSWVVSVAFALDGQRVLTGSWDQTARLWDAQTGKEMLTLTGHTNKVTAVAFSPDGNRLLTGSHDETARLWDARTGKELLILKDTKRTLTRAVFSVSYSPDGKHVLTSIGDKTVRLWDVRTGKEMLTLEGHTSVVWSVTFSPNGKQILTGSADKTARLWDARTGKELLAFKGSTAVVTSVAFAPDGKRILTGSNDLNALVWDAETGKVLVILKGHSDIVTSVSFAPDGKRVLTGSSDQTARLWDAQIGKEQVVLGGHGWMVASAAFAPDGKRILLGVGQTARLWDAQTGKEMFTFSGHMGFVTSVAFAPDGKRILTGSIDRTARLWDTQTGKELLAFKGHTHDVRSVATSPNGKQFLTGSHDRTARLWDVQAGKELITFKGHTQFVSVVAFAPDGKRIATVSDDKTARLWDVQTGEELLTFKGHTAYVKSLAFAPDGKRVVTGGSDKTVRIWDTRTGKELLVLKGCTLSVSALAFSPDGKHLLLADGKITRLWDAQTGKELLTLQGHLSSVTSVAFSPNGKQLLTGSFDKTARLWDAGTGTELCQLISLSNGSWAVVDGTGRYDASDGGDVDGLHWVVGLEPIALKQLKERYYDPSLLAKYLGFNKEPLREVAAFKDVKLYPDVAVAEVKPGDTKLTLDLSNQGGGIGRVQVFINGKELLADARGPKPNADAKKTTLTVDLAGAHLIPGKPNKVEVVTWNAEGYLSSRGLVREFDAPGEASTPAPELYAIVAGISTYGNPALNLRFAAKDAEDFATALQLGGNRFFGASKVHLTLLTTTDSPNAARPTKDNLRKAFEAAKQAKPGDVLVIYLAGHGVALQQGKDLYCYLTADTRSLDPTAMTDPAVRAATTVSSEEMSEWIKQIPALKQVMVLDTCAAGAAATKLTEKRDISGDQIRAIERLKDHTGFHVLLGCAADRVSYEANQYAQGLLTYALLQGMRGAALREEQFVDVSKLFQYAADQVPQLAQGIGGVQRPVVAAPRGSSFDVGRLETTDKAAIPLALVKPLVLRPVLINRDEDEDNLKLTPLLRQRLHETSLSTGRGKSSPIVYVPEDEFPGAIRPTGTYSVVGKMVQVRLTLKKGDEVVARLMVEGTKDDLPRLAEKLTEAILATAR